MRAKEQQCNICCNRAGGVSPLPALYFVERIMVVGVSVTDSFWFVLFMIGLLSRATFSFDQDLCTVDLVTGIDGKTDKLQLSVQVLPGYIP